MSIPWWAPWRRANGKAQQHCTACPLTACARGCRAAVIRMECGGEEARRLRHLGLYEGSCVTVVDRQDGYLLEVCGSRLAVGARLASAITVLPLGG
jgi:Fe2+ transport system protein FeoA